MKPSTGAAVRLHASWQKGGVENANGRLRRWLPRQIDIDKVSDEEIQDIILTANLTPRKCLGFNMLFRRSSKSLAKTSKYSFHKPVAPRSRVPRSAGADAASRNGDGEMRFGGSGRSSDILPGIRATAGEFIIRFARCGETALVVRTDG